MPVRTIKGFIISCQRDNYKFWIPIKTVIEWTVSQENNRGKMDNSGCFASVLPWGNVAEDQLETRWQRRQHPKGKVFILAQRRTFPCPPQTSATTSRGCLVVCRGCRCLTPERCFVAPWGDFLPRFLPLSILILTIQTGSPNFNPKGLPSFCLFPYYGLFSPTDAMPVFLRVITVLFSTTSLFFFFSDAMFNVICIFCEAVALHLFCLVHLALSWGLHKLVTPEFSAQFLCPLPILVAWQLSTMQVFIMLLTAPQPQAGTGEPKAKYKPVLGVHPPQQVSVHPRQWWSDARGSGQLHGVTASAATVEAWLLSKTKQNRVF